MTPKITASIVLPTAGADLALLTRTLETLAASELDSGVVETVLVDNGERRSEISLDPKTQERLRLRREHIPIRNKSGALNHVLPSLKGDLVLFLDDDVRVGLGWSSALLSAAGAYGDRHFYGGWMGVDYAEDEVPPEWLLQYLPLSAKGFELGPRPCAVERPVFMGCNWAAFRTRLLAVGGFSTRFGPGSTTGAVGQEATMQMALLRDGFGGRYVPAARVWHWVPPERCSPDWTISRVRRVGMQAGLHAAQSRGRPRFLLSLAGTGILLVYHGVGARVALGTTRRFGHRFRAERNRARLQGLLTAHTDPT